MVNMFRLRAKRTPGSGPPPDLLFGELAYSDTDQQLYVGRDSEAEPTVFGTGPDYGPAIATLTSDVASLETVQGSQGAAILAIESDVALLQAAPPPVTGWDYIGPTEPIALVVGATWWERVDGLTVGKWEWSGSQWLGPKLSKISPGLTLFTQFTSATSNSVASPLALEYPQNKVLIVESVFQGLATTLNASNFFTLTLRQQNQISALSSFSPTISVVLNNASQLPLIIPVNRFFLDGYFSVSASLVATGSPSVRLNQTIIYRYFR